MTKREIVIREVEKAPEIQLDEILGFVRLLHGVRFWRQLSRVRGSSAEIG
jgi:hypothetical protein